MSLSSCGLSSSVVLPSLGLPACYTLTPVDTHSCIIYFALSTDYALHTTSPGLRRLLTTTVMGGWSGSKSDGIPRGGLQPYRNQPRNHR